MELLDMESNNFSRMLQELTFSSSDMYVYTVHTVIQETGASPSKSTASEGAVGGIRSCRTEVGVRKLLFRRQQRFSDRAIALLSERS